jgi:CRP-like cAMP-binding protein
MKNDDSMLVELHTIAPFDQCSVRVLRAVAPHVDRVRVRAGTVLAREGGEPREFLVVRSGEIAASRQGTDVGVDGPGAQIGGAALLDRQPHDATWTATTELDVLVVNGPAYRWVWQTLSRAAAA